MSLAKALWIMRLARLTLRGVNAAGSAGVSSGHHSSDRGRRPAQHVNTSRGNRWTAGQAGPNGQRSAEKRRRTAEGGGREVDSGGWWKGCGQRRAEEERWTAEGGEREVDSGGRRKGGGQRRAVEGRWTEDGGERAIYCGGWRKGQRQTSEKKSGRLQRKAG